MQKKVQNPYEKHMGSPFKGAMNITITYMIFGVLWILTSDNILAALVPTQSDFYKISLFKGWFYIVLTSVLLFTLIYSRLQKYYALSDDLYDKVSVLRKTETLLNDRISAHQKSEEALKVSQDRYRLVLEGVNDGIFDWQISDNTFYLSPRLYEIIGYSAVISNYYPINLFENLLHPLEKKSVIEEIENYLKSGNGSFDREMQLLHRNGYYFWVKMYAKAIWDSEHKAIKMVGAFSDISERKAYDHKIEELAFMDSITKLPNKSKLEILMEPLLNHTLAPFAFVYFDIDHFKLINDSIGHELGDQLLLSVGQVLRESLPEIDVISRISGDEFALIVPYDGNIDYISQTIDKMMAALKEPIFLYDHEFSLTTSIGVALFPEHGASFNTLFKKADTAMYASKDNGRNQFTLFHNQLEYQITELFEIQNDMKKALTNNAFTMYYQPQVNFENGALLGAEALIRWIHPDKGIIPPDKFIGISEKTGFIKTLGLWIIESVFRDACEWSKKGYRALSYSINLSGVQVQQNDLIDSIKRLLEIYDVMPEWFTFEITENVAIDSNYATLDILNTLKSMHFKIALDDFGINYSSLSYLKTLPIDILKLDKTFVSSIATHPKDLAISESVIFLAHKMNLKVVAEGIETTVQHDILKAFGCDSAQGYLYSRPLPPDQFEKLYLSH